MVPIYKNKGDIQSCTNYRRIKLMSHTMKLCDRVIEQRLQETMQISTNQFGFMLGRSTTEAIFLIRHVMERFREQKKDLHLVFIDLEKAYDKIPRNVMWWSLDKHKVPSKYMTLIKDMYNNIVTSVRTNDGNTDYFTFLSTEHYSSFTGSQDVLSTFYPLFSCVTLCLDKQNNPFSINCSSSFGCLSRICFTKTAILFIFEKG